jgi:hypothetical protein
MNQAILIQRYQDHRTSHVLHLLLSFVTLGFWIPVWALVALSNAMERRNIRKQIERNDSAR